MTNPYGHAHRQARARLLPHAYGTPCPLCGAVMLPGQRLHLDHSRPVALGGTVGDRITHARCNESRGATLGNRMRGRIKPRMPRSGTI